MKSNPNTHRRRSRIFLILDILSLTIAFIAVAWWKPATVRVVLPKYIGPFFVLSTTWLVTSAIVGKYNFRGAKTLSDKLSSVFFSNVTVLAIMLTLMSLLQIMNFSRLMVFGTVGIATVLEIIIIHQVIVYQKSSRLFFYEGSRKEKKEIVLDKQKADRMRRQFSTSIRDGILKICGKEIYHFIEEHIPNNERDIYFTATRKAFNIENKIGQHQAIVNLEKINAVKDINLLFKVTNYRLPDGGLYFSIAETITTRRKRILDKYPVIVGPVINFFDYMFNRVFAKMYPTRLIYQSFSHKNKALSKAELLGRLYASGFEVVDEAILDNTFVFVAKKVDQPKRIDYEAIGGLIKLKRLGKDGKTIGVFKFRTMHPYAEYIQAYIYEKNNLQKGGKFNEDFRINTLGKFMRKMWLDELPMFINVLKGEMKLVGVRPLSEHYFSLYTKELQDLRITTKPGLLPPFYADSPVTLDEIMSSELRYLNAYKKHPFMTDLRFFFRILYNILIKRARSK